MNICMPTNEDIHAAFEQGEAAVMALFHDVAAQVTKLAQQLAKQEAILHELQARLAKSRRTDLPPRRWWHDAPTRPLGPHDGRPRRR